MKHIVVVLLGAIVLGGLWAFLEGPLRSPGSALHDFMEGEGRFEDQLADPLVLGGPRVRPLVLASVSDREMKRRRYALSYLGCAGYAPARATLRRIVGDEKEFDYFRADALEALWRLDPGEGKALALDYRSREDFLAKTAEQLLESGPWAECRSWFAALVRRNG